MNQGKILVGEQDGVYVLKFTGDVRVTLCTTVDTFLSSLLARDDFRSVLVDLTDTEGIDSTSLGLLAKLSLAMQRRFDVVPTLVSTSPEINRVLTTMGFDDIFHIVTEPLVDSAQLGELPPVEDSEENLRAKVLDAHLALMDLNEENRESFRDLVCALESEAVA